MSLRNARPLRWVPRGLTDAIDGTNSFSGAMTALQNLVPATHTGGIFVPRPAALVLTAFDTFSAPDAGEALFINGSRQYGFIKSARFAGHSEPFIWDTSTGAFVTITGLTSANTPVSTSAAGEWTPPTVAQIGGRIVFTHPGFALPNAFGWLDVTGFADTASGTLANSVTVTNLTKNVLLAGWRPGMTITGANIPASTRIVSVAANGLSLTISQAATGAGAVLLTVAGGTTAAPLWAAGNVNQNPLIAVPVAVALYSGRAYYAVGNAVAFSDSGDPLQATDATFVQVITFQNGLPVTALRGLPLNNQLGGQVQSLMCFQGATVVQQITGDASLSSSNLAVNTLNVAVGTLSPNSIADTPFGLMFMAPDGLRLIDFSGRISEPIGVNGEGVSLPFINAVNPSRICAAYNEDVYRISVSYHPVVNSQPQNDIVRQEFWYHLRLKIWTGPHTFAADLIAANQSGSSEFIAFPSGVVGLFSSNTTPLLTSAYVENGELLSYGYSTALFPDSGEMSENLIVDMALAASVSSNFDMICSFSNEAGQTLSLVTLTGGLTPGVVWGAFNWGSGSWGAVQAIFGQRRLAWDQPLVFKQGRLTVSGPSAGDVAIGNIYAKYQILGYLMQGFANAV